MSVYFPIAFFGSDELDSGDTVIKNALVIYEGEHKDNAGKLHSIPRSRLRRIVANTNASFNKGIDIPLMIEHSRKIVDGDGQLAKAGEIVAPFEFRQITAEDITDNRRRDLIGLFGAFTQVEVDRHTEGVEKKRIRDLSAGLNLDTDTIEEVSLVAFPAIKGCVLFSRYNEITYQGAKEAAGQSIDLRKRLQEALDIFFDVILAIDSKDENEENTPIQSNNLKLNALGEYIADVKELLKIKELGGETEEESVYDNNAYATDIVKNNFSSGKKSYAKFRKKVGA